MFDKDSPNIINAYLNNDGTTSLNSTFRVSDYINVNGLSEITISGNNGNSELCCFYDRSKTFISSFGMGTLTTRTVSVPNNAKYLRVTLNSSVLSQYQIEVGSTASTYKSFQSQSYNINLGSIELCKIGDYVDELKRSTGKNLFDKSTTNKLNANFNSSSVSTLTSNSSVTSVYIPCKANCKYTLSKTLGARFYVGYTNETPAVGVTVYGRQGADNSTEWTVTTGSEAKYLVAYVYASGVDTSLTEQQVLNTIQIEEGSTATEYEPYGKGKWYLRKEIGKKTLDGSESWYVYGTGTVNYFYYATGINISPITLNGYSNYYKYLDIEANNTNEGIFCVTNIARVRHGTEVSIENYKSWISTHNIDIYYVLATPTTTEITNETLINQLEAIHLITGTNVIEFSGDTLVSGMDINYIGEASSHL